jgi:two-component system chemotaxis response regulator CheB
MVRVLIVDDSAFMRNALSSMLSSDPEIQVVAVARDGIEAIEKIRTLKPDIVTMDVEMPRLDGISALRQIMQQNPVPVIMVSSLTTDDAKVTLDALELGAADFIPKNLSNLSIDIVNIREILISKVKQIARKGIPKRSRMPLNMDVHPAEKPQAMPVRTTGDRRVSIVAIGSSTGGPKALQEIIPRLPGEFPVPVIISQHMPASFTGHFAQRLNELSLITVKEAQEGDVLKPGVVFIAPGRGHMRVQRRRSLETVVTISEESGEYIYRPSVDALMLSVSECFPGRALGVILTGMGNDGVKGLTAMKQTGARIFAQNEDSCVVYGMPKAVVDAGIADKILSIEELAGEILNSV